MSEDVKANEPDIELLTPPEAVRAVAPEDAERMIQLNDATMKLLDAKVDEFIESVIKAPAKSTDFETKLNAIHGLGNDDIKAAANASNRFLEQPLKTLKAEEGDGKANVSKNLLALRKTVEDLDPSKHSLSPAKKVFGFLARGGRSKNYFLKYQSSQEHLNSILESLYKGQDELRKDNAAIEQEKANLWSTMERLEQYIYLAKKIDGSLSERIQTLEAQDAQKARVVKEEMLFYVRQKVQDLQTQLAVSIQGYLALDLVKKNNLELVKGVDRATTTTISALRTAVTVSQGLANQKLVLDQINALNTTTGNLIEGTSNMLKAQTTQVQAQAASATVGVEQLQKAFDNVYLAMESISSYKLKALENMRVTVNELSTEIGKAQSYLDKVRAEELEAATSDLSLEAEDLKL